MKIASSISLMWRFKALLLLSVWNVHWSPKSLMSSGGSRSSSSSTMMVSAQSTPPNDLCSAATPLTVGSGTIIVGNTSLATSDVDQVPNGDGCSGTPVIAGAPGFWYSFQGTGGRVWPTTCFSGSVAVDISVYKGASCGSANLQCVAGVMSPCGRNEKFTYNTEVGTTYYMLVRSTLKGAFQLALNSVVAPPNDVCSTATPITIGSTVAGNLTFATSDVDQVLDRNGCAGTLVYADYPGLWYSFQGTGGRVWPTTCFSGSSVTAISVYTGSCGSTNLQCVAGMDSPCSRNEKFIFNTNAGTTYYVLVKLWAGVPGPFQLVVNSVVAPPNDICSTATPITIGSTVAGNLTFATSDLDQVLDRNGCSGTLVYADYPGLWYSFQGTGGRVWPTTCFSGSSVTAISVYTGSCGSTNLQCVAGMDSPCSRNEKFTFETKAGTTYYVLVKLWSGVPGPFQLVVNSVVGPPNDICSTATPITIGSSVAGNLTFATSDLDQVLDRNGCSGTLVYADYPGLWYSFQGTGGRVWPTTCFSGSSVTAISVYTGSCGSTNLQCVAGMDSPCSRNEKFTFETKAGATYYVLVKLWSGVPGPFQLVVNSVVGPPNDICSTATPVSIGSIVSGNLTFATSDLDQVLDRNGCSGTLLYADYPGLWYSFRGTGGRVWPVTCFPESIVHAISVYTGSCGSTNLQCVAGMDNPCSRTEKFSFNTNAGTTYYVLVKLWSGAPGPFQLLISSVVPTLPGSVNSNDACANAANVAVGSSIAGNVSLANGDEAEVPGDCLAGNPIGLRPGLWYNFNGTGGNVTALTCSPGSMFTHVSVYKGACGSTTLQCVAGTFDSCTLPKFTFSADLGTQYFVNVRSASTSTSGSRTFDLTLYNESKPTQTAAPKSAPTNAPVVSPPTAGPPTAGPPTAGPPTAGPPTAGGIGGSPTSASSPMAPVVVVAPTTPKSAPVVVPTSPSSPIAAPMATPTADAPQPPTRKKCGLLGLRVFCPRSRCGVLGRIFRLCKT